MEQLEYIKIETCIGSFDLYLHQGKAVYFAFEDEQQRAKAFLHKKFRQFTLVPGGPEAVKYRTQIEEFFDGKRTVFSIPYTLLVTPFQQKVLTAVDSIPYGDVLSYKDIGSLIGSAGFRAIGGAVKANPLPILIPCHRVIGSHGIGGYSMGEGLKTKQFLLLLEKHNDRQP